MMNISLQTVVALPNLGGLVSYNDNIMCIGSCFADAIGGRLARLWFNCMVNPFGVLFNPASIAQSIARILEDREFNTSDFALQDGLYICYDLHGQFSGEDLHRCVSDANEALHRAHNMLMKTDTLIITFGSAFVYQLKESGMVVANCHKTPQTAFVRSRLSAEKIVDAYSLLIDSLLAVRPNMKFVFTVSPVRHLRDGIHENTLSKSVLHIAEEDIVGRYSEHCVYFPAYEIAIDELRDYRFYAEDMAHLTATAEEYIFNRFVSCALDKKGIETVGKAEMLRQMLSHRVQNPNSQKAKEFYKKLREKAEEFCVLVPRQRVEDIMGE